LDQIAFTALTAMVANMKHQLAAFETMLAAVANVKKSSVKTPGFTASLPNATHLSDDEEAMIAKSIESVRLEELQRMDQSAENYFVKTMQEVADGSGNQEST